VAKPIVVSWQGEVSSFALTRISRSRLYGSRQRVHLDPTGARCQRAALTDDGSLLLEQGMTAQGYFDPSGEWVPNNTLTGMSPEGELVDKVDSTLGVSQELEGPLDPQDVLDLGVSSVYSLEPEEISESLGARLSEGDIFRFRFAYRAGFNTEMGILLGNEQGAFALVGRPQPTDWNELAQIVQPLDDDEDDDLDDDLDFEMF